ncbi:hypothetical protein I2485_12915 [Nesterenkonia sp. E16_7]|uniref:hypothetical protein n=1 Tax=unclassified Nesterenkonia TaxID=2629769 RepID=UPI001A923FD5|nr:MULTISPECIES: hypothetical protein [unclassified Nesterenkonia]MBO0595858.1 hypothetical protein [Nesterenkonia sp. E16_10]MBO0599543.1 hypothetical protein [Nesterenkonia sp. E16_7]
MTIALRRTAAVGAALSGLLHLVMLTHGHHLGLALAMAGMAIICLPCAGHLWRTPSPGTWFTIATMNTAMLGLHLWMITGTEQGHPHPVSRTLGADQAALSAHDHAAAGAFETGLPAGTTAAVVEPGSGPGLLHEVLLPVASGLAALEILLAVTALILLRRGVAPTRRAELPGPAPGVQTGNSALHAESISIHANEAILIPGPSPTDKGVTR